MCMLHANILSLQYRQLRGESVYQSGIINYQPTAINITYYQPSAPHSGLRTGTGDSLALIQYAAWTEGAEDRVKYERL